MIEVPEIRQPIVDIEYDQAEDWRMNAACRGQNPELFFPGKGELQALKLARAVCRSCSEKIPCLQDALDNKDLGVRAGTTERQRMKIRRLGLTAQQFLDTVTETS